MGGLTGAVHWWEDSQLRVLVLISLVIQFFFLFFPLLRRWVLPGWFRFIMWLAYHAGDAVAIYALATLFNRHKDKGDGGVGGGGSSSNNTLLEVVWAPVLLIHLGGHDGVTAYNIEDNELWSRHLLTAVSQVTVAVYVFCKSWPPGGDKTLLQAAILLFIIGVGKCFFKAWGFKRASIYNLASSAKQINDGSMYNNLDGYVTLARDIVVPKQQKDHHQVVEEQDPGEQERLVGGRGEASNLFIDLSSPYPGRISIFKKFWGNREERAYASVQAGLASAFLLLYTKLKALSFEEISNNSCAAQLSIIFMQLSRLWLPWAAIALFHHSHREAYNGIDVKVTYAILCCTAVLEFYSFFTVVLVKDSTLFFRRHNGPSWYRKMIPFCKKNRSSRKVLWPETVAQYSLAGYFVRNKKHSIKMRIVSFVGCKDFLDQQWCMEPCFSSARITQLVLRYLEDGWKQKIQDAASYRSFNNHSSHWGLNMNRPFDECVLLWHLATEFCFFSTSFPDHRCAFVEETELEPGAEIIIHGDTEMVPAGKCSQESAECKAIQCRQMSNYMVYLLFVNPEMLLPGTRRNIFKTAYGELKDILRDWNWNPVCWSRCTPCGVRLVEEEANVMNTLITVMKNKTKKRASQEESSKEATVTETVITVTQQKSERSSQEESSMEGSNRDESFIHQAWDDLAERLLEMDEMKRWEEIQDVWVQMLCFSASRCRGYLHAKALGKGGEFLSYVWLLLFYMGMETFSERLQRELLPSCQGNNDTTPPQTSKFCAGTTASTS